MAMAKLLAPPAHSPITIRYMDNFSTRIIDWQRKHGRHDLPWQNTRDPYRIWLSEIMLQQTRVATATPYYQRFLLRFPDIAALASASEDEVMRHWAGLGYYARARNLQQAARQIVDLHGGIFPQTMAEVLALPGIGRSTAAAICAFAFGTRAAIMDGNVKRVFARHFGIAGDAKSRIVEESLWTIASRMLPDTDIEGYTQGLMDLGATVCRRSSPLCLLCPVKDGCIAHLEGRTDALPGCPAKRKAAHREVRMLVLVCQGSVLLERRPPSGIWGGLLSFPEVAVDGDALATAGRRFGVADLTSTSLPKIEHGFTHFSLTIHPLKIVVRKRNLVAMEPGLVWVNFADAGTSALPAPVKKILAGMAAGLEPVGTLQE
jgi:A/G-specific adenine glycosylase